MPNRKANLIVSSRGGDALAKKKATKKKKK